MDLRRKSRTLCTVPVSSSFQLLQPKNECKSPSKYSPVDLSSLKKEYQSLPQVSPTPSPTNVERVEITSNNDISTKNDENNLMSSTSLLFHI